MIAPEFLRLIDELVIGEISAEDHGRLQEFLKRDAGARAIFRERMDLEAGLRSWAAEVPEKSTQIPIQKQASIPFAKRIRSNAVFILATLTAVLLIAMIPWMWNGVISSGQNQVVEGPVKSAPNIPVVSVRDLGTVRQETGAQWVGQASPRNGRLQKGRLELAKGVAELSFDSGTNIVLEAPCEMMVLTSSSARLMNGNAVVDVTELSNGFVLHTPESQVIDEGTEYAVSVREKQTEVHVFEGSVFWVPTTTPNVQAEIRIAEGEAYRFDRSTPNVSTRISFGQRQFVRSPVEPSLKQSDHALLAYDNFEDASGQEGGAFGWLQDWEAGGRGRVKPARFIDIEDEVSFGQRRRMLLEDGCDVRREFESPLQLHPGKNLYVSFMARRQSTQNVGDGQSLQISLEPDLPGRGRRLHQIVSFGITTDGFPFINSGRAITKTASRISQDQNYRCVLELAVSKEGTLPSLRVYQPDEQIDDVKPTLWTVSGKSGSIVYPPASIRIITGENATWQVDELKVGTTWQAVTGPTATD